VLDYEPLFALDPYGIDAKAKQGLYQEWLSALSAHHRRLCPPYDRLVRALGENPALPVRLFKHYDLRSVDESAVVKTMTSSGTTGQQVSRIFLDRETSARQTKVLTRIVSSFTGKSRMPLLIIDSRAVIKDRAMFSARGAGILGFSLLGRDVTYALDEDMQLDLEGITAFAHKHAGETVLLFGFTFMVWQYFCQALIEKGITLDLQGVLIHGGGWKKLKDSAVGTDEFKRVVRLVSGIDRVHNYYGMVEQTGSIFMECEHGHLHASVFSDIAIIDPLTMRPAPGGTGLIRCTSLLPTSYPGHILLTEDQGEVLGEDDCPCGRKGRYFAVQGRMEGAEIRGCSDTHESR
jgi:hypothetical protein